MASLGLTSSAATSPNVAALISRPEFVHFCFFCGTLLIMIWPFDMFFRYTLLSVALIVSNAACALYRSSRLYLWTTWWRIFRAPFVPVMFKDFFVGNHLTSLSKPLLDIAYAFCFYFSGAFLTYGMPAMLRACMHACISLLLFGCVYYHRMGGLSRDGRFVALGNHHIYEHSCCIVTDSYCVQ